MFKFHKHDFQEKGNNLWCKCGKIQKLECGHYWKVHHEETITVMGMYKHAVQTLICEKCGEIRYVDFTSGIQKQL